MLLIRAAQPAAVCAADMWASIANGDAFDHSEPAQEMMRTLGDQERKHAFWHVNDVTMYPPVAPGFGWERFRVA